MFFQVLSNVPDANDHILRGILFFLCAYLLVESALIYAVKYGVKKCHTFSMDFFTDVVGKKVLITLFLVSGHT